MKSFKLFSSSTKQTKHNFHKITLFQGDGIGPEISKSVVDIFSHMKIPIEWENHEISNVALNDKGDLISQEALDSILRNKVALKGPFATPIGKGHRSLNVTLRKNLKLYANVRPVKSLSGVKTLYDNVDLVTIRENTEGEYSGLEHEVVPGVYENLKIISSDACERIAKYAFEYAVQNGRKCVVAAHKMGVQKKGDGLFVQKCRDMSVNYPSILYKEENMDTLCMKLAQSPRNYDVMVMPNLYGDIVSDLCAGFIGGLGLTQSANIGEKAAVFEAVHGSAPDIAGKNKANPTALLLSSVMMLKHIGLMKEGEIIEKAIFDVLDEGKYRTGDLGGKASTTEYTKAIIEKIKI